MYSEAILDHFYHPRNVGTLDDSDLAVGTGVVGTSGNGDVLRLQIYVVADHKVSAAKFKAHGAAATIAVGSFLTEWVLNKSLNQIQQLPSRLLMRELALPEQKLYVALLGEDALKMAVDDYYSKTVAIQTKVIP
jgi:nitrogen fixation protein NifU and related proteins